MTVVQHTSVLGGGRADLLRPHGTGRDWTIDQAAAQSYAHAIAVDLAWSAPEDVAVSRVMNALLDGHLNFAADRALAAQLATIVPGLRRVMHRARAFRRRALHTAVRSGCTQLLDLGAGFPAGDELAWPGTVVQVDRDPVVVADLNRATSRGRAVLAADLLAVDPLLDLIAERGLLRLDAPVTVLLTMILHHLEDVAARQLLTCLTRRLPTGSRLIVSVLTSDPLTDPQRAALTTRRTVTLPLYLRTAERTAAILAAADVPVRSATGRSGLLTAAITLSGPADLDASTAVRNLQYPSRRTPRRLQHNVTRQLAGDAPQTESSVEQSGRVQ
ncbi:hypothetical protein GCM10009827_101390 [Dactylosporangium maewongense]|uniref:S-adenosyl methyltransferase n=1 Tax=Dactylosporangium maewongense TaxID=634393 RepID=A0ABN2CSD4_9ACTN